MPDKWLPQFTFEDYEICCRRHNEYHITKYQTRVLLVVEKKFVIKLSSFIKFAVIENLGLRLARIQSFT